jgi:hypothetical protein
MTIRPLVPAFVLLVATVCPNIAHADDTGAAETAAARALAVDGVKLALADKCDDALEKLERAQKLKHSPVVLRHLGECQVKVGQWVEGSESLRKLLREPLPEGASPAIEQAYESAASTLRELLPRIPSMKIMVTAPRDAALLVRVDGKQIAESAVGVELPTDPGEHVVEVTAHGYLKASSSVKLGASANQTVVLELKRDPSARPAAVGAPTPPRTVARNESNSPERVGKPEETGSATGKTLAYVSYGVAAAGLGVGLAFGQSAMQDERELRNECPGRVCTPGSRDSLEFAQTKGTIATIGFITAGAGVTLGTVLLLASSSSSPSDTKNATRRRYTASAAFRPRAKIGPGSVTLATDF